MFETPVSHALQTRANTKLFSVNQIRGAAKQGANNYKRKTMRTSAGVLSNDSSFTPYRLSRNLR